MSGFVCDFTSLVGVDGFECRVAANAAARHHRRGSAVAHGGARITEEVTA